MEYYISYVAAVVFIFVFRALETCSAKQITIQIPKAKPSDDGWYGYTELQSCGYSIGNSSYFEFSVKTCTGAQVALMSGPMDNYQLYEVVISGMDNYETVIRKYKGGMTMIRSHGGMLDCSAFRAFQIHWDNGVISLVRKCRLGKWLKILSWKDPNPRPIRYVGVTTGSWASSTWRFNQNVGENQDTLQDIQFETRKQKGPNYYYTHLTDYQYKMGQQTSITFSVKACSDIYVALLSKDTDTCTMYEVIIGGYGNTISVIRRGKNRYNYVKKPSSPADCNEFRSFIVSWPRGVVSVWYETKVGDWQFLMSLRDRKPIDVRYIGMTTGKAASGTWKVAL
ncbi:uncharacterized protein LOC110447826 [Mizuhopecten yessoensis]|uniref:C3 and PZP-like alpha-2-macroglobulin domain-containing protein 8 n=1 Tax=Mizuhopecten yessoensis TaxID=6573 RepID=A0A210QUK0_MIZYE|nr:uncharacterized protein LOC110447826 [Mizuhopecten yessoensis]OWF52386.1 C3 and PZP-like alpha-2-macroglobulin domain-containing protein 8 [Mizuhopecten yessoensis]